MRVFVSSRRIAVAAVSSAVTPLFEARTRVSPMIAGAEARRSTRGSTGLSCRETKEWRRAGRSEEELARNTGVRASILLDCGVASFERTRPGDLRLAGSRARAATVGESSFLGCRNDDLTHDVDRRDLGVPFCLQCSSRPARCAPSDLINDVLRNRGSSPTLVGSMVFPAEALRREKSRGGTEANGSASLAPLDLLPGFKLGLGGPTELDIRDSTSESLLESSLSPGADTSRRALIAVKWWVRRAGGSTLE